MRVIGESTFSKFTPFIWGFSVHTSSILGSPIHPMLKERWSHETKIAFLSQQDNTLIRSGYNLSFKIQNSRTSAGFIGKTDPYEPLNSIAFYRLYLRYSNRKSTWIVGSYRLQIGEGIIKTNGNPSFREKGNLLKDALVKLGYTWNTESGNNKAVLWQTNTGGNHYNHLHISNRTGVSSSINVGSEDSDTEETTSTSFDSAAKGKLDNILNSTFNGSSIKDLIGGEETSTIETLNRIFKTISSFTS